MQVEKTAQIASIYSINNSQIKEGVKKDFGFFETYLDHAGVPYDTEAPTIYHRWCCFSMVGALLGRQAFLPFGHSCLFPNQYIMLMGSPGARKGTALNIARGLLRGAGYGRFAPDKCSKERFLMEMKQYDDEDPIQAEDLEVLTLDEPAEIYVMSGEFTDFMGPNNMEFVTMLTNLWDNLSEYKQPKIQGKSVTVHKPTVNIVGGNTQQGFALAFPPESLGNGFLSRMILVHGEPTDNKITWPKPADELVGAFLVEHLKLVKEKIKGAFTITEEARRIGDRIYKECPPIDDHRFKHYATRRFIHVIKLAMILAATDLTMEIGTEHLLKANTLLHFTENNMPKALGEFGKNKFAEVTNTIMNILTAATRPVDLKTLFRAVATDLTKITELGDIMKNLTHAGKVQVMSIAGKQGYMPLIEKKLEWDDNLIMPEWLTDKERGWIG